MALEKWDYRSPDTIGIGGSETSVVELSWRLAKRGYKVRVFAPLGNGCKPHWRGTTWHDIEELPKFRGEEAYWSIQRFPQEVMNNDYKGRLTLFLHDVLSPGITPEVVERVEAIHVLSEAHLNFVATALPYTKPKLVRTIDGVRVDLFEQIEAQGPVPRNPKKLMYASSPDRGLLQCLLPMWPEIHRLCPDAELHVFYGLDNLEEISKRNDPRANQCRVMIEQCKKAQDIPGVIWRGRVSQSVLYREWLSSGIWFYPSDFEETFCICAAEAMCGGAIPVTTARWAIHEHVFAGVKVNGRAYESALTRAELKGHLLFLLNNPNRQEELRKPMMARARALFDWELAVDHWVAMINGYEWPYAVHQWSFQHDHAEGHTLNLGCADDGGKLKQRTDIQVDNADINRYDIGLKTENPIDFIADARNLEGINDDAYDTVVFGEVMEHMTDEDCIKSMRECLRVAKKVVITTPYDPRPVKMQQPTWQEEQLQAMYTDGVTTAHHERDEATLRKLIADAGGHIDFWQQISYPWGYGFGVVVTRDANE